MAAETTTSGENSVDTDVTEIAERIYRLSTFLPTAGPTGLAFNQFLIDAEEPLLFHCGQRSLFPSVSQAARRVLDLKRLRWITFSHIEGDECGALDEWLAAAPQAQASHGRLGCALWLNDMSARPPVMRRDGDVLDLGGRRVRWLETPHMPHGWEAGHWFEEVTGCLFCSDLFALGGRTPATTTDDIIGPAIDLDRRVGFMTKTPQTAATIGRLSALAPRTLAPMHGPAFSGHATEALAGLGKHYASQLKAAAIDAEA
ncbi:MAG TPA: MBL fold metallo-hydrolase [Stellaceae bacterium]|nr:MBL fold metallo-hydrolase [Stellaceae bacterium]